MYRQPGADPEIRGRVRDAAPDPIPTGNADARPQAGSPQPAGSAVVESQLAPAGRREGDPSGLPAPQRQAEPGSPAALAGTGPRRSRRGQVIALLLVAATGLGGAFGYYYWTVGRFVVSTDDAYVRADTTTLAAKVSGYVSSIRIADNAPVRAGDVIATIDDGDYRLAVDAARDKVATQQATIERFGRQIAAQQAIVEQAKAQLVSAQAAAKRAQSELERQQALAVKDFASRQTLEQAIANRDQTAAAVESARAGIESAQATVEVLNAQRQEAVRTLGELRTALAKAERDLSFTVMRAPVDGVIGNRAVQPGDYVQPGQRLASLVPLDDVYIDANFKETQLSGLRPGQTVELSVDAVPGRDFEGTVDSVAPASGSVFSLLPPDNATGNFTKIVQRLAVRVRVPHDVAAEHLLRPGMSVVVSVNTKSPVVARAAGTVTKTALVGEQPN